MWEDNRGWTFQLEEELLWIMVKLKRLDNGFVYYKHAVFQFTRRYLMDWSGVDYF